MFRVTLDVDKYHRSVRHTRQQLAITMRNGVEAGSKEGARDAKQRGRFKNRTGELRGSIKVIKLSRTGNTVWGGYEATAEHASYLEDGTPPHEITPQNRTGGASGRRKAFHTSGKRAGKTVKNPVSRAGGGKFLRFYIGGRVVFARKVKHPGTKADPFMEPAMEQAERAAVTSIWRGLEGISVTIWR